MSQDPAEKAAEKEGDTTAVGACWLCTHECTAHDCASLARTEHRLSTA